VTGVGTLVLVVIIGMVAGAIGGAVLAAFRGRNSDQLAGGGLL
jgi:uncharacterized membrane protein YoaK (UPF0700 family)